MSSLMMAAPPKKGRPSKGRPKAILERMATQEADALERKARQDAKDKEFAELLRAIEGESAKASAVVAEAKAGAFSCAPPRL